MITTLKSFFSKFLNMLMGYSGASELAMDQHIHEQSQITSRAQLDLLISKFDRDLEDAGSSCNKEHCLLNDDISRFSGYLYGN